MNLEWIGLQAALDRATLPLRRSLAKAAAPDPSRLGYPLFSERISDRKRRWQIERQPNPYSAVSSKLDGQAYMRSLGHAVPEVYGSYPSLDEIPRFEDLPANFVLKPTRGWSGAGVFMMRDGFDLIRQRRFTRDELIRTSKAFNGSGKEGIAGPWVAEELIFAFDRSGEPPIDYKFYCFGPKVVAIQINRRTGLEKPKYLYWFRDPNWQPLPFRLNWDKYPQRSSLPRPPCLDAMVRIASDAAGRLNIFVRVDMYATDRGPVFGEFTAYPHMGRNHTPRADAWLGSHWKTPDGGI
jgi:TupA-like ATPgrasp